MSTPRNLDDRDLLPVIESRDKPMLIAFQAGWCPPCRALTPNLEALAYEAGDRVSIVRVDIDQAPLAAQAFGIRTVPTLVLFDPEKSLGARIGWQSLAQLRAWVEPVTRTVLQHQTAIAHG